MTDGPATRRGARGSCVDGGRRRSALAQCGGQRRQVVATCVAAVLPCRWWWRFALQVLRGVAVVAPAMNGVEEDEDEEGGEETFRLMHRRGPAKTLRPRRCEGKEGRRTVAIVVAAVVVVVWVVGEGWYRLGRAATTVGRQPPAVGGGRRRRPRRRAAAAPRASARQHRGVGRGGWVVGRAVVGSVVCGGEEGEIGSTPTPWV